MSLDLWHFVHALVPHALVLCVPSHVVFTRALSGLGTRSALATGQLRHTWPDMAASWPVGLPGLPRERLTSHEPVEVRS